MANPLPEQITLSPHAIFQKINAEAVILDMQSEQYYALNEVGMRLWELFAEGKSVQAAIQVLLDEFDVEESALHSDVSQWLHDLSELGLIVIDHAK
jgi:hypothetical protein